MNLKKKAGLALALAAIFTTGGANLALASNVTANDGGTVTSGTGDYLVVSGNTAGVATVTMANKATVESGGIVATTGTTTVVIEGDGSGTGTLEINGTGGELAALNDAAGTAVNLTTTANLEVNGTAIASKTLTLGDDASGAGTLDVSGSLDVNELVTDGNNSIYVGGDITENTTAAMNVNKLTTDGNTFIQVGSDDAVYGGTGILTVDTADLNGAMIFGDPAWNTTTGQYNATGIAIEQFSNVTTLTRINGILVAGQNSHFTLGLDTTDWTSQYVHNAIDNRWGTWNTTADRITAAFAVEGPFVLDSATGGIHVDGSLTEGIALPGAANTMAFASQSLLIVDATNIGNTAATAALSGYHATPATNATNAQVLLGGAWDSNTPAYESNGGTAGSSLAMFNSHANGTYTVLNDITTLYADKGLAGGAVITTGTEILASLALANNATKTFTQAEFVNLFGDNWNGENLIFSSDLLTGTWSITKDGTSNYDMTLDVERNDRSVREVYPHLSSGMAGMVDALYTTGANNTIAGLANGGSDNAGINFVSRATDNFFFPDHKEGARVLEGAAQIAVAAGVPAASLNVINKFSSLIVDHNNLLNDTQPAYGNEPGQIGVWVTPFYGYSDVDGMDTGSKFENGWELSYGGAAFGVDYNVNEAFRLGLALNVGGGDSESQGDFYKTENDFDFFGVSLYGSYTNGAWGLTGDIGYTALDNEIEQKLPAAMQMGSKLKADVDSDAFTVGLTGQYRFTTSNNLNITPHLGLRYTKISTDDANVKAGHDRIFKVDTEDQNLFQIPLGVQFSGDIITDGGWTITPSADLGVLFTAGDTDVDSKARIVNTGFRGTTNADVVDSAAFTGALGIKAKADNGLSLGLDYGILASGNQTDHSVSGMLRFEF
ncbi:hypothetical protein C4J81_18970 (plasmid) [Deltaproteobacteria bacterium Smac51]|nr:hypothetical protein C4J81_18970 [Deltaproteobacteria bacterium Smac51]